MATMKDFTDSRCLDFCKLSHAVHNRQGRGQTNKQSRCVFCIPTNFDDEGQSVTITIELPSSDIFPKHTKIPNMKWLHPPQSVMKGQAPHLSSDICAAMTVTTACLRALQNRSGRTLCDSMPRQKLPEHRNYKNPISKTSSL